MSAREDAGHTPGWVVVQHPKEKHRWFVQEVVAGHSQDVCEVANQSKPERARLIAAAPDLLVAAQALAEADDARPPQDVQKMFERAIELTRAALLKALPQSTATEKGEG